MTAIPILLLLLLTVAPRATAGQATGSISGIVMSPADQPLAGVVVISSSGGEKEPRLQVTGPVGEFLFENLPEGSYRLLATHPGYQDEVVEDVSVEAGKETKLELSLELERFSESIIIRDVSPLVKEPEPAPPVELGIEQLELLPLATDRFQEAFPLLPGVVRDPEGRLSFNGSRPSQSILLVNGANVTDPVTGDFAVELPLRAVEAVEVNDIPYSAEYGRATAAVAEVTTRGGTDEWDLDAGDLLPKPNFRDGKIRGIRAFVPQIGISGPLEEGKLWFLQGLGYRFVRSRIYDVDTGEDERTLESWDSFTQLDWRMASDHHLTTTFSLFPTEVDNLGLDALTSAAATPEFHSSGYNVAVSERSMFDRTLLETTVAFKTFDASLTPKSTGVSRLTPEGLRDNYFNEIDRESRRFEIQSAVTHSVPDYYGEHVLKVGGHVGRTSFDGIDAWLPVEVVDAQGRIVKRVDFVGDPMLDGSDVQVSAFVQDRWRLNPQLGLELGLRYDFDRLVSEHQLAPRFAFAYALDPGGRTVVRGGVGIFYDHVYLHVDGFERFQRRVETSYGPDGEPEGPPIPFQNVVSEEGLDQPRSTAWNVEVDRFLAEGLEVRLGYRERHGSSELVVDRIVEGDRGRLLLSSSGASVARELGLTLRVTTRRESELFLSYSKSRSTGDLNHFDTLYQNLRSPLVHENESSLFDLDVPHRFLAWGLWKFGDFYVAPGIEWRSGFPFTVFDERYDPVGERNRGGRFPAFFSFDVRVTKGVTIKGRRVRLGVQLYNLGSHFNPRDVVSNVGSLRFGQFLNSVDMGVSFRFSIGS